LTEPRPRVARPLGGAYATVTRVDRRITTDGDHILAVVALDVEPQAREGGLVAL